MFVYLDLRASSLSLSLSHLAPCARESFFSLSLSSCMIFFFSCKRDSSSSSSSIVIVSKTQTKTKKPFLFYLFIFCFKINFKPHTIIIKREMFVSFFCSFFLLSFKNESNRERERGNEGALSWCCGNGEMVVLLV